MQLVFQPTTKKDIAICKVKGGRHNGLIIYINMGHCCDNCTKKCYNSKKKCCKDCLSGISGAGCHDCNNIGELKEFRIMDNGIIRYIPSHDKIEHGFIFGATGSGKSVFCAHYAEQYQKIFKDNPVYLVSNIDEDSAIDSIEDLIRIPIEDIMNGKITPKAIHDSLIIFDDVDAIVDKNISNKIERIRDQLLTTGRHSKVTVLVTSHLGANFLHTKTSINESAFTVIFPRGGNFVHIHRILHDYNGLDSRQEEKIKKLDSRWVLFHKNYPCFVVYEKGCYLL
jgi:hypothetical protein